MKLVDVKDYIKQVMKDNLDEAKHHQYPNSVFYTSENDGLKKALDKIEEYEQGKNKIVSVDYQIHDTRGHCPTCDYGSTYVRDMYVKYDDNIKVHFHVCSTWDGEYCISESDWMTTILNCDTRDELIEWFCNKMNVNIDKYPHAYKEYEFSKYDVFYELFDTSDNDEVNIHTHYLTGSDKK